MSPDAHLSRPAKTSPNKLPGPDGETEGCWILEVGSAVVRLSASGLPAARVAELDYLLTPGAPSPDGEPTDFCIRRQDPSGSFRLSQGDELVAESHEARPLLATAESLMHDLILAKGTDHVMFHGAAVARGEQAIWLSGPTGSGKSTLCAALLARSGFSFLADDTILWDPVKRSLSDYPRPLRLKLDDEGLFASWHERGLRFQVEYLENTLWYFNPFREFPERTSGAPPGGVIIECSYRPGGTLSIEGQGRGQGLCKLLENVHESPGFHSTEVFSVAAGLASRFSFLRISYGDCHQAAARIEELLEEELLEPHD